MKIILLSFLIILNSCSTIKVDPNSNKAQYDSFWGKVITNKKVHTPSTFTIQYDVNEVFPNDKIAQEQLKDVNSINKKSSFFLWGGLGLALTYLLIQRDNYSSGTYWGLFAVGYIPGVVYSHIGTSKMGEIIGEYNARNKYSLAPIINNSENHTNYGLAISTSL